MSTPEQTANAQPPAQSGGFQQKLVAWVSSAVGVILLAIGFMRAYDSIFPSLPGCTSDSAKTTLGEIFKEKKLELSSLTNQKVLTDSSSEKTCQADFTTPAEAGTLSYRISWKDKEAQVRITNVDAHPR